MTAPSYAQPTPLAAAVSVVDNISQMGSLYGPASSQPGKSMDRLSLGESEKNTEFNKAKLKILHEQLERVTHEQEAYSSNQNSYEAEIKSIFRPKFTKGDTAIEPSNQFLRRLQAGQIQPMTSGIPLAAGVPHHPSLGVLNPSCPQIAAVDLLQVQTHQMNQIADALRSSLPADR